MDKTHQVWADLDPNYSGFKGVSAQTTPKPRVVGRGRRGRGVDTSGVGRGVLRPEDTRDRGGGSQITIGTKAEGGDGDGGDDGGGGGDNDDGDDDGDDDDD